MILFYSFRQWIFIQILLYFIHRTWKSFILQSYFWWIRHIFFIIQIISIKVYFIIINNKIIILCSLTIIIIIFFFFGIFIIYINWYYFFFISVNIFIFFGIIQRIKLFFIYFFIFLYLISVAYYLLKYYSFDHFTMPFIKIIIFCRKCSFNWIIWFLFFTKNIFPPFLYIYNFIYIILWFFIF